LSLERTLWQVAASLRFHRGGASEQRAWAHALRAACAHLPGAILHQAEGDSAGSPLGARRSPPVAATKHLLFAPLRVAKHLVQGPPDRRAPATASTLAGRLDAAAE
jgi:hypothetical protein